MQVNLDVAHRRILAFGLIGLAEGAARILVSGDEAFDPVVVAGQLSVMAWAGLRGIDRPVDMH